MSNEDEDKAEIRKAMEYHIRAQELDPQIIAALTELCDRLLVVDPGNKTFVQEMIALSQAGLDAANEQGKDDTAWLALKQILRESLPAPKVADRDGAGRGR